MRNRKKGAGKCQMSAATNTSLDARNPLVDRSDSDLFLIGVSANDLLQSELDLRRFIRFAIRSLSSKLFILPERSES